MKAPTVAQPFYKVPEEAQGRRPLFTFLPEKSVVRTVQGMPSPVNIVGDVEDLT